MSNAKTEVLPTTTTTTTTTTVPTRRSILHPASSPRPFAGWRDAAQTEDLPTIAARPRVSTHHKPTGSRERLAYASTGMKGLRRRGTLSRHLRAALTALALAAAILIPMQLYAAQGISSARQAALASSQRDAAQATEQAEQAAPAPASQPDVRSDIQADWVTEHTDAAYDRTNPAASPLDLPRCTTSPDTPLPCLATLSPDSRRAVVLEEDTSLTAFVRR